MKLTSLQVDPVKAKEGVWFEYDDDVQFLVARMGNSQFQTFLQKHRKLAQVSRANSELMQEVTRKAAAHTILLDWKGIEDDEGNPLAYTPELGFEIFCKEEYSVIYQFIMQCSGEVESFRNEEETEDTGNLSGGSNGFLPGETNLQA